MAKHRRFDFASVATPAPLRDSAVRILQQETHGGILDLDQAKWIPVDIIDPDPNQFRKHFDEVSLRDLALNILAQGVLQPIIVEWVADTSRFRIIAGERRRRATNLAAQLQAEDPSVSSRDLTRMPAIVRDPTLVERCIQQVSENESREDYGDVERAFAYERLKELLDVTWDDLAVKLGLSRQRIHQIRSTKNRLAESVRDDITGRRITERQARKLVLLPPPAQEAVATAIKEQNLTQQQSEAVIQRVRRRIETTTAEVQKNLTEHFGSPVSLVGESPASAEARSAERQPWSTSLVADAVEEIVHPADNALAVKPTVEKLPRAEIDRFLSWVAERSQFDNLVEEKSITQSRLLPALDDLITWAAALRDRLGGNVNHGSHSDVPG